jgi:hypothetical protein
MFHPRAFIVPLPNIAVAQIRENIHSPDAAVGRAPLGSLR